MRFVPKTVLGARPSSHVSLVGFTLLQLLQRNVQLGAPVKFSLLSSHWFVYGVRHRFTIINLSRTILQYRHFLDIIRYIISVRRHVLFVNEHRNSAAAVAAVAQSVGEPYAVGRWVGGSLTNFKKIWLMYVRLLRLERTTGLSTFRLALKKFLAGLSVSKALPGAIFFNSVKDSHWAAIESWALHIPSAGISDTDASTHSVLYPIPGNDDAFGSILFFNQLLAKAVLIAKLSDMLRLYRSFQLSLKSLADRLERKKSSRSKRFSSASQHRGARKRRA